MNLFLEQTAAMTLSHVSADLMIVSLCGRRSSELRSGGNIPRIVPQPRIPDLPSPSLGTLRSERGTLFHPSSL